MEKEENSELVLRWEHNCLGNVLRGGWMNLCPEIENGMLGSICFAVLETKLNRYTNDYKTGHRGFKEAFEENFPRMN